jgi:cytochrome c biogenesis protein ResB
MGWLWRFLSSRNTGIVLLIAVSLLLTIGAVLPNPDLMQRADAIKLKFESPLLFKLGENFNSMKLGGSYIFAFIGILLITSTTFCSVDRAMKRMKARRASLFNLPSDNKVISIEVNDNTLNIEEKLRSIIQANRWKTKESVIEDKYTILARKGDLGFWGSIFFHVILISLLIGLVIYHFSAFYASIRFSEGQTIKLTKKNITSIDRMPLLGISLPELLFKFNKFSAKYHDDYTATDFTADFDIVNLKTDKQWKQIIKVNKPFTYNGMDFLMIFQGYSPNFILYKNGTPVLDTVVALDFDQDFRDTFDIDDYGLHVVAQFFPDMDRNEDGRVYTKSRRPKNPHLGIEVYQGDTKVFRKLLGKGEGGSFGPYKLVFNDLHHWITLNLVKEAGIGFFFICAVIGLVGLFIRIIDPERQIIASIEDTHKGHVVNFYHSSKHFEGMLEENMNDIINKFKKEMHVNSKAGTARSQH